MKTGHQKVLKKKLKNGLTILVRPTHQIPKVSTQLWYNVGSKDEQSGQKGIAHFIEHMIFKGTKELSESDINLITHKLSGYCNAFTSYDYTGYLFDFPTSNWRQALPIMADCMSNCAFDQQMLNSELKAVIQELKMYKDSYESSLVEDMISNIFTGHPYGHPIIGYKHDLWSLNRDGLVDFYKKHYVPNNATLVVVGDVDPEEVFKLAQEYFESIPSNEQYVKENYPVVKDLISKSITLHRDVKQSTVMIAYLIPGVKSKLDYAVDVTSWILGSGRSSRLYKKLVDELELVIDLSSFAYDLFDEGLFFITFVPKDIDKADYIISLIQNELDVLAKEGPTQAELQRASRKVETDYLSLLENNQKQAYIIGKSYLANGDENYIFNYLEGNNPGLAKDVQNLIKDCFRSSLMCVGKILPLESKDKDLWLNFQKASDQEDAKILSAKVRDLPVQEGVKVHNIHVNKTDKFDFPKYETFTLNNGLEVLFFDNKNLPKINLIIELKARHYYDPEDKIGLGNFVSDMMLEDTSKYSAIELAQEIESYGMSLDTTPGYVSMLMLSKDFKKGLSLLTNILTDAIFKLDSVERVREQIISDIKDYWDDPSQFVGQIVRENVYTGHPYSKNILGSIETVNKISRDDLFDYYKKVITPSKARIAIVGDLTGYNLKEILESTLGKWHGPEALEISFNELSRVKSKEINYPINRDQVVLCFAGLSVKRTDPDYDKLLLFDQVFCGGSLGSMSSRLFQLRERSGLFYTIGGSIIARADEQPGMSLIKTIVSIDRLKEAEEVIVNEIDHASKNLTMEELLQSKNAIINSLVDNFASNKQIANTFLFLRRYNFTQSFFDDRAANLTKITINQVQEAASKILKSKDMIKIRIGRVQD